MRWKLEDDVTRMGADKWVEEKLRKIGKRKEHYCPANEFSVGCN
jgi:hypothetical protein